MKIKEIIFIIICLAFMGMLAFGSIKRTDTEILLSIEKKVNRMSNQIDQLCWEYLKETK